MIIKDNGKTMTSTRVTFDSEGTHRMQKLMKAAGVKDFASVIDRALEVYETALNMVGNERTAVRLQATDPDGHISIRSVVEPKFDLTTTRLICAKCGVCADHKEDRHEGKCRNCHATETVRQIRDTMGNWISEE